MSHNSVPLSTNTDPQTIAQVATSNATTEPQTQDDWTVHAINIHGLFFERWCSKVIGETSGWKVRSTNYPIEYPPPNGPWRGKESALDIRAERKSTNECLTLVIECKKNNPEYINWNFFPKNPSSVAESRIVIARLGNTVPDPNLPNNWSVEGTLLSETTTMPICDDARETRGDYFSYKRNNKDFTKTSNAAIQDAAYQAAIALRAIYGEEALYSSTLGKAAKSSEFNPAIPWLSQTILPVICTTAELYICRFDAEYVDPNTGVIPYDKVVLSKVNELVYEYPLPKHLQVGPRDLAVQIANQGMDSFTRMYIFVVHSSHLSSFLQDFPQTSAQAH